MSVTKAFSFEPMLCESVEWPPEGRQWHYELKLDGFRAMEASSGAAQSFGHATTRISHADFQALRSALLELPSDTVIDGEIVALDQKGKPGFNLLVGIGGGAAEIVLYAFDLLILRGNDVRSWPLEARRACLFEIAPQLRPSIRYSERFDAPLPDLIKMVRQHRLEGIVAKRVGSPYRSGERSGDLLKWRANRGQELVIGGYIANDSGVDSLLVGYYEDRDLMYAGRVRAGLAAASRHLLLPHLEELQIARCPFSNLPERSEGHWGDGLTAGKWICAAGSILS